LARAYDCGSFVSTRSRGWTASRVRPLPPWSQHARAGCRAGRQRVGYDVGDHPGDHAASCQRHRADAGCATPLGALWSWGATPGRANSAGAVRL